MARRCKECSLDWPTEWEKCGKCKGPVNVVPGAVPMSQRDAMRITAHADFELFLEAETPVARKRRQRAAAEERAKLDAIFAELEALVQQ